LVNLIWLLNYGSRLAVRFYFSILTGKVFERKRNAERHGEISLNLKNIKFDKEEIQKFIKNYFKYIILCLLVILLVIVLIVIATKKDVKEEENGGKEEESSIEEVTDGSTQESVITLPSSDSSTSESVAEENNALKQDAYPEVNQLIQSYYDAVAAADVEQLKLLVNTPDNIDSAQLEKRKEDIEGYLNLSCYTKEGPLDRTYIVFVYHEIKFRNIETAAPGLSKLYVCTDEAGNLYLCNGELDEETRNYIDQVSQDEDVTALANEVMQKYTDALNADAALADCMNKLSQGTSQQSQDSTAEETPVSEDTAAE
jgi:hypothetical protein